MSEVRIGVVGAGPAGLTAAIAARKLGLEATVFERAPDFKHVGAGIALQSNGLRALDALGLLEAFLPRMQLVQVFRLEAAGGKTLGVMEMARLVVPRNHLAVVLRSELQEHLSSATRDAGASILFGHRCLGATRDSGKAQLRFENGEVEHFDVVVAADGIHSRVRGSLRLPTRVRATGKAYLRGIAEYPPSELVGREIGGSKGLFGLSPLPGDRTYFYCSVPLGGWREILETDLEAWIRSWSDYGPDVVGVLQAVADWGSVVYDEVSEVRLKRWSRSPFFLVGDAAHAMTPNIGQGASAAMVDSVVLVRLLAEAFAGGRTLEEVGREYEWVRRRFTARVQFASRLSGVFADLSSPLLRPAREFVAKVGAGSRIGSRRFLEIAAGHNRREERYLSAPLDLS